MNGDKKRSHTYGVMQLGFGFFLIFLSFSAAQSFQTSSTGSQGSITLGVLYTFFCLGNFLAAPLVLHIGVLRSLMLGGTMYVAFIVQTAFKFPLWVIYIISSLNGLGAAILWVAQGTALSRFAQWTGSGKASGIFFASYQANQFIGNLVIALLFQNGVKDWLVFTIASVIALIGTVSFVFLRIPEERNMKDYGYIAVVGEETIQKIQGIKSIFFHPQLCSLFPIIFFNGLNEGFVFGSFPLLVKHKNFKFYALSVYGLFNGLTSFALGRILGSQYNRFIIPVGFVVSAACFLFLSLYQGSYNGVELSIYFVLAASLGLVGAFWTTFVCSCIMDAFPFQAELAFSVLRMVQSSATAASFFYAPSVSSKVEASICLMFSILGAAALFISKPHKQADVV